MNKKNYQTWKTVIPHFRNRGNKKIAKKIAVNAVLLCMLLLTSVSVFAQNTFQVTGKVTDEKGISLVGVSIKEYGSGNGTSTDVDGQFRINISSSNSSLQFTYIGFVPKQVAVNGQATISVQLREESTSLNEVVVVGYGTQKKGDLSSSIASVDIDLLQRNAVLPNAAAALEGTTPGLSVTPSTGAPGAKINIKVRGPNTFGNNQPLVVIDGSPGDLNDVNPEDIASMQVLKDAAAGAIYGSRAANGVIIVTTKKGEAGAVSIDLRTSYGVQTPSKSLPVTNAEQYAIIDNALHKTANIAPFNILSDPASLGTGTDWQKTFYKPAPISNTYLGISGGNQGSTYRISGSFAKQDGIAVTSGLQKAILHVNGHQKRGAFEFGQSIGFTSYKEDRILDWLVQGLLVAQPIIPLYDANNDGGYGGVPSIIPVQGYNAYGLSKLSENTSSNHNLNADMYAQMKFFKAFTYKINVGYKTWDGYNYGYTPTYYMSTNVQNQYATLNESRSRTQHWLIENTLNYDQKLGLNNINALIGYTVEQDQNRSLGGTVKGFPNNQIRVIDATTGYSIDASGSAQQSDLISMLARITYNYDNRYYLTSNLRRDGSSKFGKVNQYGVFPSASAAWRISNESFFKSIKPIVNNLKIRGSYGVLGNEPGSNYSYIPQLGYSAARGYLYGSTFVSGAAISGYTNPGIKWESTKSLDLGFDVELLNNFSITGDYFLNTTDNLLLNVPIPPSTGGGAPLVNIGKLQNKGVEFNAIYNSPVLKSGFQYNITGNVSTVRNKVLQLGYGGEVIYGTNPTRATTSPVTAAKVGYPIGGFFVKQADGLFQNMQEINSWTGKDGKLLQPNAQPGDVRYKDIDEDGIINSKDVVYSGSAFPDFSYGLNFSANYKNFDFTLFLQGTYGNKMFDSNTWRLSQGSSDYNFSTSLLNAWTPDNPNTTVPRLTFNDPNHNEDPSTRFLYDASYLRVKTLQLGYSVSHGMKKFGISGLRLYISANNLLTMTKYPGYDPSYTSNGLLDGGLDQSLYPLAKIINGGVSIHF